MHRTHLFSHVTLLLTMVLTPMGHTKVLDSLQVEGLLNPGQAALVRSQSGLRRGDDIRTLDIQEAVKRLYSLGLYKKIDFFVLNETDTTISLQVTIQEYPIVESIDYSGNKKLKDKDLEEAISLRKGQAASDAQLDQADREITDAYKEKGFLRAGVTHTLLQTKIPGNFIVKFSIDEGPKVQVESISFFGNEAFTEKKLKRKFKTKEQRLFWGGDFDEVLYRKHLDSLVLFYQNEGYLDASVVRDSFWYGEKKKEIFIDIEIEEGQQFYAGDFFFSGNTVVESAELQNLVALKSGKPFQQSKFEMTRELIKNRYREDGFLWVQTEEKKRFRDDTIDVTFAIREGQPAIVHKIDIVGNDKTREKVIRREIRLIPGEKYKQSAMMRSVREITMLNYFDNVNPELQPNDDGSVDFIFEIQEKENIGQLQVGAAYSRIDQFMGTFSVSIPNFRGASQLLELNSEWGKYRRVFSFGFTEPWAFNTPTKLSGELFYRHYSYEQYGTDYLDKYQSYGFSGTIGRRLKWPDDFFYTSLNYQFARRDDFGDPYDGRLMSVIREGLLSKVALTLQRNDQDYVNFPTRGSKFYLTPEIAGLGGDYRFLKGTVGYDVFIPLPWKFVFGLQNKFGLVAPLGNNRITISREDLFTIGEIMYPYVDGQLRGYVDPSIKGGYIDYREGDGNTMLALNSEIRYPIIDQQFYIGVFADAANTWSALKHLDLSDMNKSVGFGIRLLIPMLGLLGFDFGWGLDSFDRDGHFSNKPQPHLEFQFQMGRGFQ